MKRGRRHTFAVSESTSPESMSLYISCMSREITMKCFMAARRGTRFRLGGRVCEEKVCLYCYKPPCGSRRPPPARAPVPCARPPRTALPPRGGVPGLSPPAAGGRWGRSMLTRFGTNSRASSVMRPCTRSPPCRPPPSLPECLRCCLRCCDCCDCCCCCCCCDCCCRLRCDWCWCGCWCCGSSERLAPPCRHRARLLLAAPSCPSPSPSPPSSSLPLSTSCFPRNVSPSSSVSSYSSL